MHVNVGMLPTHNYHNYSYIVRLSGMLGRGESLSIEGIKQNCEMNYFMQQANIKNVTIAQFGDGNKADST